MRPVLLRSSLALALVLAFAAVLAAPAGATGAKGPRYEMKIDEGVTTLPEYETPDWTSVSVSPRAQVAVSIIHNGLTVERQVENGGAGVRGPQVGDVVTFESPVGTLIASVIYDGLPVADPTVCAGSTNFSGTNSAGNVVEGFYVARTPIFDRYGHFQEIKQTAFGEAQVKTLSGTTFGGAFLKPLALGEDVIAVESLKTPLPGEATYTYTSETERPVAGCPLPPPVYSPPPPPALAGSFSKLLHSTIRALMKGAAHDVVTINQAGTVVQDLYLKGGTMPAFASSTKHKPPPALLLARGSATAKAPGPVTIVMHPTRRGRTKLRSSHKLTAVLITTLRNARGARLNLQRHTLTLQH
jgi:hypothetical protein